ncbi:hypothetical protein [Nonomuraea sp. NPDC050643]|uniref:hypothetical protein n=1 Tax=Nonomuraea sp. NPDC050643 TaxID=3155660 RepID=UPI0033D88399
MDVRQHDDGSKPGMHDLDLVSEGDVLQGAVEVSAAADGGFIELWNLVNGQGRRIYPDLDGGWMLELRPATRVKPLLQALPALLARWERRGIREVSQRGGFGPASMQASQLGIVRAHQGGTDFPGSVYFTIDLPLDKAGGFVADTGDALALWLGDWLREPRQADVLKKLAASSAPRRHAFILFPGFTTAPFEVADLLMRQSAPLPTVAPNLPTEVTDVWAVSTWDSGDGFRWSETDGWMRFAKSSEIDSQEIVTANHKTDISTCAE